MNPFNLNALKLPMREPKLIAQAFQMMPGVSASSLDVFLGLCHEDSDYAGEVWNFPSGAKLSRTRRLTLRGRIASSKLHLHGYAADKSDVLSAHLYMKAAHHLLQAKEAMDASESSTPLSLKRKYTGFAWEFEDGSLSESARPGLIAAANWVRDKRNAFVSMFGVVDRETGAIDFGRGLIAEQRQDYAKRLEEIEEALLLL